MNKYIKNSVMVGMGFFQNIWTKIFHFSTYCGSSLLLVSPSSEVTLERGGILKLGRRAKLCKNSSLRIRKGAECTIGAGASIGDGCIVTCHEKITIGKDTLLSPYVLVYDHDHDFKSKGYVLKRKYNTAPIVIGNNVWIGANTIILKGTVIGDNCVVGAGAVLSGTYPKGSIIVQKRETSVHTLK